MAEDLKIPEKKIPAGEQAVSFEQTAEKNIEKKEIYLLQENLMY